MFDTLSCLQCPDCSSALPIFCALLVDDGRMVLITACPTCADGATVKCYRDIDQETHIEAFCRGLPMVNYQKKRAA